MKRIDEILDAAADLYVTGQHHWIQGVAGDLEGGACMAQAIWMAAGCPSVIGTTGQEQEPTLLRYSEARSFVTDNLGFNSQAYDAIPEWNDTIARSQQEVVDKLREIAKVYREETQVEQ